VGRAVDERAGASGEEFHHGTGGDMRATAMSDTKAGDGRIFPLAYPQLGVWHVARSGAQWRAGYVGLELRMEGVLEVGAMAQALQDLVSRHAALRTIAFEENHVPHQRVLPGAQVPVHVWEVAQRALDGALCTIEWGGLGLGEAIPFRADLFKLSEREHVLLISAHRVAVDTPSRKILLEDLSRALEGPER